MADAGQIRAINRTSILRALSQGVVLSKNDLVRETGLSFPTVSRMIDTLLDTGELTDMGLGGSTGGRCAQLYALNPLHAATLSIRMEACEMGWFVCDLTGKQLECGRGLCEAGALQTIDTLLVRVQARYPQLGAISMGLAGTVSRGTVTEVFGYDELRGVNLLAHLTDRTGLPAAVAGDMSIASAGYWARHGRKSKALVCIYMGTVGIGSGIVIDGQPWHGASEFAGELLYLPIEENSRENILNHLEGLDMPHYYGKVIRAYAALLNPDRVILYENPLIEGRADDIRRECARNLPSQAIPQIELSNEFDLDYERGLTDLAYGLLGYPKAAAAYPAD